jgi:hypothetical protein
MTQLAEGIRDRVQDEEISGVFGLPELVGILGQEIDSNKIIRAFAANSAFRAAERHELSTVDNPFRRPVRPDDLEWLDYSKPLGVDRILKLSALLGHRMLRNVYDVDLLYVLPNPKTADPAAVADRKAFYSRRNRIYSALAGPILEQHLFTVLEDMRQPLREPSMNGLIGYVSEYYQRRVAEPGRAFGIALSARERKEAATFTLLQMSAYAPAANRAVAGALRGDYGQVHPGLHHLLLDEYGAWANASQRYQDLLTAAGISLTPAAHWQMYLGSSLARGNYVHHLARNRELFLRFLGALIHKKIDDHVTGPRFAAIAEEAFGLAPEPGGPGSALSEAALSEAGVPGLLTQLVGPFVEASGAAAVEEIYAGFAGAAWLGDTWDRDLSEQLAWADDIPAYVEKARKIDQYLTENNIQVDLDTFIESCEETSTTHVHDDHRLVMIETGKMHFWNNITHQIELNTGDKVLIPLSRLHGSTVLSGECTYHQPIIPEDMLNRIC